MATAATETSWGGCARIHAAWGEKEAKKLGRRPSQASVSRRVVDASSTRWFLSFYISLLRLILVFGDDLLEVPRAEGRGLGADDVPAG